MALFILYLAVYFILNVCRVVMLFFHRHPHKTVRTTRSYPSG